jgi:hypothetical protein
VGWREWVALPDWGVEHVKAKVDTGARTSSLHAFGLSLTERDGVTVARFVIHPWQRSEADEAEVETRVVAHRAVRSSSGTVEQRPVVHPPVVMAGHALTAEITLTRRDEMGFRMLIGREALRRRFVVDPGSSYVGGRSDGPVRRRNRGQV